MVSRIRRLALCSLGLLHLIHITHCGMIGDGSRSLYTHLPVNASDTRGACVVDGRIHYSETAVPRDHPCHYCICYASRVSCFWKQCAAPPADCVVMELENVCNPSLYICSIPDDISREPKRVYGEKLNSPPKRSFGKTRTKVLRRRRFGRDTKEDQRRARRSLPIEEEFSEQFQRAWSAYIKGGSSRFKRAIGTFPNQQNSIAFRDTSCTILGVVYNLGDVIGIASDPCMECRCAAGQMFCSPKCCFLPAGFSEDSIRGISQSLRGRSRSPMRSPFYDARLQMEEDSDELV